MIAPAPRSLPPRAYGAALAVIDAALDQPSPSPALRAALAAWEAAAHDPRDTLARIPPAVWRVMRVTERAFALLVHAPRPLTAREVATVMGYDRAAVAAILAQLARTGAVLRDTTPGVTLYRAADSERATTITKRYRVVAALVERGPLSIDDLAANVLRGHPKNRDGDARNTLRSLERARIVRPFSDESGRVFWEVTPTLMHYDDPTPFDLTALGGAAPDQGDAGD